jgi:hypothetical protein
MRLGFFCRYVVILLGCLVNALITDSRFFACIMLRTSYQIECAQKCICQLCHVMEMDVALTWGALRCQRWGRVGSDDTPAEACGSRPTAAVLGRLGDPWVLLSGAHTRDVS